MIKVNSSVIVPDPDRPDDLWQHSFVGTVNKIKRNDYAEVEDQEGNVFTVEVARLEEED